MPNVYEDSSLMQTKEMPYFQKTLHSENEYHKASPILQSGNEIDDFQGENSESPSIDTGDRSPQDASVLGKEELAQKRKLQNRAAQKAFRDRKSSKMKELENKLIKSEDERHRLIECLDKLKKETSLEKSEVVFSKPAELAVDDMIYQTDHIVESLLDNQYDDPETGSKILLLASVWDYLLYKAEQEGIQVNILEIMQMLRGNEQCHGFGPGYPVDMIDRAYELWKLGHGVE